MASYVLVPLANASVHKREEVSFWSDLTLRLILPKYCCGVLIQNLAVPYMFETKRHSFLKPSYLFIYCKAHARNLDLDVPQLELIFSPSLLGILCRSQLDVLYRVN